MTTPDTPTTVPLPGGGRVPTEAFAYAFTRGFAGVTTTTDAYTTTPNPVLTGTVYAVAVCATCGRYWRACPGHRQQAQLQLRQVIA